MFCPFSFELHTLLYFLLLKLDKRTFVGTSSIFFLTVNTTKIPIFYYQDLFTLAYFPSIAITAPLVYVGALFGRSFLNWVSQVWFTRIILTGTTIAGLWLIIRYFLQWNFNLEKMVKLVIGNVQNIFFFQFHFLKFIFSILCG